MPPRLVRPALMLATVAILAAVALALSPPAGPADARPTLPGRYPFVGALFPLRPSGTLGRHFCTASVVASPAGDLVVTAAHCMERRPAGTVVFVPDYWRGHEPLGVWLVTRIVEDASWRARHDPNDDFAFLVVHQEGVIGGVQQFTGSEGVAIGLPAGRSVTVVGYPDTPNRPIACTSRLRAYSRTQYKFVCRGFTDGTSGSPLLIRGRSRAAPPRVIGVIGGLEHGGHTSSVSYSARFGTGLAALYRQARAAGSRWSRRYVAGGRAAAS